MVDNTWGMTVSERVWNKMRKDVDLLMFGNTEPQVYQMSVLWREATGKTKHYLAREIKRRRSMKNVL